jgi:ketosteroid isomerase-like protein
MPALRQILPATLILACALAACAPKEALTPAASAPAVDTATVVAGITNLWAKWVAADKAGDLTAFMALTTEDVRMDSKGMPAMIGRAAFQAAMAGPFGQAKYLDVAAKPDFTVAVSNELAHQAGSYYERYTMKGMKGEITDYGRYATAVVKGPDGQWRWAYIMAMVDSTVTKK